nr:spastin-like [Rhipicephalus microplus]
MALHVSVVVFVFSGCPSARHEECHYGHLSATSGSSAAMAASSGDPDAKLLIRQKQHHKRAFDFISKAVKYEELANDLYRNGIEELQKGITNNFAQRKGPSWEWAHRLTDKMKVNLDMCKDMLDSLQSMVKIENLGDDLPWHASVARPQANQNHREWQKAANGHDAAPVLGGPMWLKMAQNGGSGSQVNERSPPLPPRIGATLKNQAAIASLQGVAMHAVAPRSQTLPGNTPVGGAWTTDESWSWLSQPAANEAGPMPTAARPWLTSSN